MSNVPKLFSRKYVVVFAAVISSFVQLALWVPSYAFAEYVVVTDEFEAGTSGNGAVFIHISPVLTLEIRSEESANLGHRFSVHAAPFSDLII